VMVGVEAAQCELAGGEVGLRRKRQARHAALVMAGFFALREPGLGRRGGLAVALAMVTAAGARHALVLVIAPEAVGRGWQGAGLSGQGGGDGRAGGPGGGDTDGRRAPERGGR
jgi:hypothetical protein